MELAPAGRLGEFFAGPCLLLCPFLKPDPMLKRHKKTPFLTANWRLNRLQVLADNVSMMLKVSSGFGGCNEELDILFLREVPYQTGGL